MKALLFVVSTYAINRLLGEKPPSDHPDDIAGARWGGWSAVLLILGGCTVGTIDG